MRSILSRTNNTEAGQALPLFGLMLFVLFGFTAMSIDVGRYVWARTSMQAGVDAAALAAAQSMPSQTAADAKATEYWIDNSGFIQSQGTNVSFQVTYPPGNKAIKVEGEADIPTWFARLFGIDEWHVTAEGQAESQVLDIAIVFDISGSMCYDWPFLHTESTEGILMSPGNNTPTLQSAIAAGGAANSIVITLSSNAIFNSTNASTNNTNFGYSSTSRYHQQTSLSGRNGIIAIPTGTAAAPNWSSYELFDITAVGPGANQLTVTRAQSNQWTGGSTSKLAHVVGLPIYANRSRCDHAAATPTGPFMPYDGAVDAAQYFTTLFNTAYDKIGLATYSTNTTLRSSLTGSHATVSSTLGAIAYPDGSTNIAGGLAAGRQILDGTGKRANAVRVLVLLTDGIANQVCGSTTYSVSSYNATPCGSTNSGSTTQAQNHAYSEAIRAANGDIMIFTIGLGNGVNSAFLERVADGGVNGVGPCQDNENGCRYFFAPTTNDLDEAFEAIAESTHIALVK